MAEGKSRYGKKEYRALEEYSVNVEKVVLNRDFVQHSHDFYEIVLILSGTGEHLVGSQVYPLKRGDVFVIKGDTCHGFRRARELSMVNVMYDSSLLFAQSDRLRQVAGFAYLFMVQPEILQQEAYPYTVYLEPEAVDAAEQLCDFLIRQLEDREGQYQAAVEYGFKALAAYLANHYQTRDALSEKMRVFTKAVQYLQSNAAGRVKLQKAAEAAAVSQRHLERIFLEICGESPVAYLTDLRLKHADTLLRTTCRTVAQIAEESGFQDPNYFSRVYKKKYGVSPGKNRSGRPPVSE